MAPSVTKASTEFHKDEKCLCFHGEHLYESKILQKEMVDAKDRKQGFRYYVHYKGWKNTWDDWVDENRLRKLTDENKQIARSLLEEEKRKQKEEREAKELTKKPNTVSQKNRKSLGSEFGSFRGSEERSSSVQAPPRGTKRGRDWPTIEKEETFATRPSIRIPLPDHLKGLLVDDWENVTKQLQLVPIPSPHPVSSILAEYSDSEMARRRPGSADADVLQEVIQGVREYFDKSLGRILLYRFERDQWLDIHERMTDEDLPDSGATEVGVEAKLAGKTPSEVYGAEHLCRLFVSMPELIAQTNMDAQSVGRLREELTKMTQWLGKSSHKYFAKRYEDPGAEYIEKSKGTG